MRRGLSRVAVPPQIANRSETGMILAPTRGKISNENIAIGKRGGAKVLLNFFPEQNGARIRGGSEKIATISSAPVEAMFVYVSGSAKKFFAADATDIYDITIVADPDVPPTASVEGQTSGYYATEQFGTTGGNFLYIVNGADSALLYDGSSFQAITDEETYGLSYDAQSGNFTVGQIVTGGTSAATATIVNDVDGGTDGILHVQSISGTFQNNETITDPITGSATSDIPSGVTTINDIVITGVTTSDLSDVFAYRNRLYFVEEGTLSAWYLPIDSIGGDATEIPLRGVFNKGGSILFGSSWSIEDAGEGVDDKIVFVSTEGELVVFEGTDPGNADWRHIGTYDVSKPLGKNATMIAGGDLIIAAVEGMVPVSQAITKDAAALSISSVSRDIEPDWREHVAARSTLPWEILKWPEMNMAVVSLPVIDTSTPSQCLVVNLETGAWADYSGWDIRSMALHDGIGYFGSSDGKVYQMEEGGTDDGAQYECQLSPLFKGFGSVAVTKHCRLARAVFLASTGFIAKLSVSFDYRTSFPAPPGSFVPSGDVGIWDTSLWDLAVWSGAGQRQVSTKWQSVSGAGFSLAPQLQITVNAATTPDVLFSAMHIVYEQGSVVA